MTNCHDEVYATDCSLVGIINAWKDQCKKNETGMERDYGISPLSVIIGRGDRQDPLVIAT